MIQLVEAALHPRIGLIFFFVPSVPLCFKFFFKGLKHRGHGEENGSVDLITYRS